MANENVFIHDIPLSAFTEYFARKNEQDAIEGNRRYKPIMTNMRLTPMTATFKSTAGDSVELMYNDMTGAFLKDADRIADVTKLSGGIEITGPKIGDMADAYSLNYDCYMRSLFGGVSFYPYFGVIRGEYYYSVSPIKADGKLTDFAINAGSIDEIDASDDRRISNRFGGSIDFSTMKAKNGDVIFDVDVSTGEDAADSYAVAYYRLMSDGYEIGRIYRLPRLKMQLRDADGFEYIDQYTNNKVRLLESYDGPFMSYHRSMRDVMSGSNLTAAKTASADKTAYSIVPSLSKSEPTGKWLLSIQQTGESRRTTISALMPYSIIDPAITDAKGIETTIQSTREVSGYSATGTSYNKLMAIPAGAFISSALKLRISSERIYYRDIGRYGTWTLSNMAAAAKGDVFSESNDLADCITYLIMMWMLLRHRFMNNYYYCLSDAKAWVGAYDLTAANVAYFIWCALILSGCSTTFKAKASDGESDSFDDFIYRIRDRLREVSNSSEESMRLVAKFVNANGNGKNDFKTTYYNIVYMHNNDKLTDYYDGCAFSADFDAAWETIASLLKNGIMTKSFLTKYSMTTDGEDIAEVTMPAVKLTESGQFGSSVGIFPTDASSCVELSGINDDLIISDAINPDVMSEIMAYLINDRFKVSSDMSSIRSKLSYCDMNDVELPSSGAAANAVVTIFDSANLASADRLANAGAYSRLRRAAVKNRNQTGWFDVDAISGNGPDYVFCSRFMAAVATTGQGISAMKPAAKRLFDAAGSGKGKYYEDYHKYATLCNMSFITGFVDVEGMPYKYVFYPGMVQGMPKLPVLKMIALPEWISRMTEYYDGIDSKLDVREAAMVGVKVRAGVEYAMRYLYCSYSQGVDSTIDDSGLSGIYAAKSFDGIVNAFSEASLLKYNGAMSSMVRESGRMYLTLKKTLMDAVDSMFASESQRVFSGLISDECSMDAYVYGIESDLMPLYADDRANGSDADRSVKGMSFSYIQSLSSASASASTSLAAKSQSALKAGDENEITRSVDDDSPFYKIGRYSDYGTDDDARSGLISGAESVLSNQKLRSRSGIRSASKDIRLSNAMEKHAAAAMIKSNFVDLMAGFAYRDNSSGGFDETRYKEDYEIHFKDKVAHVAKKDPGFEWDMPEGGADGIMLSFSNEHPNESSAAFLAEFKRQKGV